MKEILEKRKSIRKYKEEPLGKKELQEIREKIHTVVPLYHHIKIDMILFEDGKKIQETFKGIKNSYAKVKSPHYIAFTSENKEGYLENIGYMGEQLVLKLTEMGIGTCWLGSAIDQKVFRQITKVKENQEYVILIAFGKPLERLKRVENRNRLKIEKVFTGDIPKYEKDILNALINAPSAVNSQPWRVEIQEKRWDFYLKNNNFFTKKLLYDLNHIDMGIGMSHVVWMAKSLGYEVELEKRNVEKIKGEKYIYSVILKK